MPIPWLVVLQSVPWTDVIRNAPKVADAAKKLWNTVSRGPDQPPRPVSAPVLDVSTDKQALSELQARVASLEAAVSELHSQMLASSELIKTLAEQNGQLVARIEANRVRMVWLSSATAAIAIVAMACLVIALHNGA